VTSIEHRQPDGASAERTRFAWRRTNLATIAVALLTIRVAVRDGLDAWRSIAIAVTCAGWLTGLWLSQRRIRAMADRPPRNVGRTLPMTALLVVGFAVVGIVLVAAG
jgi:uncharacterized membrane protein YidH (DUF202 family)